MDRDHLHIHPLRVHVLEALFRCEAQFRALDGNAFAVTDDSSQPGSWLVAAAMPGLSSVNSLPETLRHEMGMNVDGPHVRTSFSRTTAHPAKLAGQLAVRST